MPRADKILLEQYGLLKDLMCCIPDVIYFKDKSGKLLMVNDAFAKGLGCKPEDVVGKTDFDIFPRDRAKLMARDDTLVIETGKPIIDKIERATRPDGVDNYVSTTKIPRYDAQGRIIGLIGITRDITRRKQIESLREEKKSIEKKVEALKDLDKLKSQFISVVSHELRTPLTIVKEAVSLISGERTGKINPKQRLLINEATINIERLKNIINDLLDISRIESGLFKLRYSLVNLCDLIRDSSGYFIKLAQEKGIKLEYLLPKNEINIFVDPERITQILNNFIENAIKFTEEGGRITIDVKTFEFKIRVGVIDTGIGISKADLPKLFNKFTQVSGIESAERKGLGLGLSIVKDIVAKHGGEVWVESGLGVGSKFYFTLPRFYTTDILDNSVRQKINSLLNKGLSLYLINLSIVNFGELEKISNPDLNRLTVNLKAIIESVSMEFSKAHKYKSEIVLASSKGRRYDIIFTEINEAEVNKFCEEIRDSIRAYFKKHKLGEIFMNLGVLYYNQAVKPGTAAQTQANINIKKIHLGSELRQHKRINYDGQIGIYSNKDKAKFLPAIDISEGGLCFISNHRFAADTELKIRLQLNKNKPFFVFCRVAWIKDIEKLDGSNLYKIGLEFVKLKSMYRQLIAKFIDTASSWL